MQVVATAPGAQEAMTYPQQTAHVMERLSVQTQLSILRFAEFLATSDEDDRFDVELFDEANCHDDGHRTSAEELRKKYGI
jgi:hypothetical protein